jgi:hypothetical protein
MSSATIRLSKMIPRPSSWRSLNPKADPVLAAAAGSLSLVAGSLATGSAGSLAAGSGDASTAGSFAVGSAGLSDDA